MKNAIRMLQEGKRRFLANGLIDCRGQQQMNSPRFSPRNKRESTTRQCERHWLRNCRRRGDDAEMIVDVRREEDIANHQKTYSIHRHVQLQMFLADLKLQRRALLRRRRLRGRRRRKRQDGMRSLRLA